MPLLAGLFVSAIGGLIKFLLRFFTKRIAIGLAVVAAVVGLFAAFYATVNGAASTIQAIAPPYVTIGASWVVPTNADECLTACVSGLIARWFYVHNVWLVMLKAGT